MALLTDDEYIVGYRAGYADAVADREARETGFSRVVVFIDPADGLLTSSYQKGNEPHAMSRLMAGIADAHNRLMLEFYDKDEPDDDGE